VTTSSSKRKKWAAENTGRVAFESIKERERSFRYGGDWQPRGQHRESAFEEGKGCNQGKIGLSVHCRRCACGNQNEKKKKIPMGEARSSQSARASGGLDLRKRKIIKRRGFCPHSRYGDQALKKRARKRRMPKEKAVAHRGRKKDTKTKERRNNRKESSKKNEGISWILRRSKVVRQSGVPGIGHLKKRGERSEYGKGEGRSSAKERGKRLPTIVLLQNKIQRVPSQIECFLSGGEKCAASRRGTEKKKKGILFIATAGAENKCKKERVPIKRVARRAPERRQASM